MTKFGLLRGLRMPAEKKAVLYKEFLRKRTKSRYKRYKNKLVSVLRYAEKQYFRNKLNESKDDIKRTWTIMNKIIRRGNKVNRYISDSFIHNNCRLV